MKRVFVWFFIIGILTGCAIAGYVYLETTKADHLDQLVAEIKSNPLKERSSNIEVRDITDIKIYNIEGESKFQIVYGNYSFYLDKAESYGEDITEKLKVLNLTIERKGMNLAVFYKGEELPTYVK